MPEEPAIHDDEHLANALRDHRASPGQEPSPQDPGQAPDSNAGQGPASTPPPWGDDFEPERAWSTIQRQRQTERNLRDQLQEHQRRQMSDQQRTESERDQFKRERDEARVDRERYRIAATRGIPIDLLSSIKGETVEELEQNADVLKRHIGGGQPVAAPDFGAGARPTGNGAAEEDFSAMIRRSAGRPA